MGWVKLDDKFPDHPKVLEVGPAAAWLYVCGLAYCNRMLTDGLIPTAAIRRLADVDDPAALAARLVAAGMWDEAEGGYQVHDYLDYQPSRAQVEAERASNARRVADWRERHPKRGNAQSNAVTYPTSDDVSNGVCNTVTDGVGNAVSNAAPVPGPVPVPQDQAISRPVAVDSASTRPPARKESKRAPRQADELFDAMVAWMDVEPAELTAASRGRINAALQELRAVNATPDELTRRGAEYAARWPHLDRSPNGLSANWPKLARALPPKQPQTTGRSRDRPGLMSTVSGALDILNGHRPAERDDDIIDVQRVPHPVAGHLAPPRPH